MDAIPDYTILNEISRTTYTSVYRVWREGSTAIFKTHTPVHPSSSWLTHLRHEYEILRTLDQVDGVVRPREFVRHGGRYGLVIEDDQALDLRGLIDSEQLDLHQRISIVVDVARGLEGVHARNVVHKDVNPRNIIHNLQSGCTRLIDFGIASMIPRETAALCDLGQLDGTLAYIAPEQTGRMNRSIDYRADFYSLGVVLYELVTGRQPFETDDALELIHAHLARAPVPPDELDPTLPGPLSDIAMRLLEKEPEQRYQSVQGIIADLQFCLDAGEALPSDDASAPATAIPDFQVGRFDVPARLQIPEKLYGRDAEVEELLAVFETASAGPAALMLIAGPSGIGKTSLVHEVHRPMVRKSGYFIAGKFDQLKRSVPYAALIQAFTDLVRQILTEPEDRIAAWRERLLAALANRGLLIVDVIPELEHIIGPQPSLPPVLPNEEKDRFQLTFMSFVCSIASPDHPLVIFLDDLQWADVPSFELIELMLTDPDTQHLLLIGAYRDNEVGHTHPLMFTVPKVRAVDTPVHTITVRHLDADTIEDLLSDTLRIAPEAARDLAALCYEKTEGNPFVLREFLKVLCEEKLLQCHLPDPGADSRPAWYWDLDDLRRSPVTNNMANLLVGRVAGLHEPARRALSYAACIGMRFSLGLLAVALDQSLSATARLLWDALQKDLILLDADDQPTVIALSKGVPDEVDADTAADVRCWFRHDRIRQTAYDQIEAESLPQVHLHIGRLMLKCYNEAQRDERLFDILQHLNRARDLLTDSDERLRLIRLNFKAGCRALASTAYQQAVHYLQTGMEVLGDDSWADYQLTLGFYKNRAQAEILQGNPANSDALIAVALAHANNRIDRVSLHLMSLGRYAMASEWSKAIEVGCKALAEMDVTIPPADSLAEETRRENRELRTIIDKSSIRALAELPRAQAPELDLLFAVLANVQLASYFSDPMLCAWLGVKMVNLCIKHGNASQAGRAYASYAISLIETQRDYRTAYAFGQVALTLAKKSGIPGAQCRTIVALVASVSHWCDSFSAVDDLCKEGLTDGLRAGLVDQIGYIMSLRLMYRYSAGEPLADLQEQVVEAHTYCKRMTNILLRDTMQVLGEAIRGLMAESETGLAFEQRDMDDPIFAAMTDRNKSFCRSLQAQICYLMGAYQDAIRCAHDRNRYWSSEVSQTSTKAIFYETLSVLALAADVSDIAHADLALIRTNLAKLEQWDQHCPASYRSKLRLAQAEFARIESRDWVAVQHYQEALVAVGKEGFLHEEAVIHERAGRFWLDRGNHAYAQHHLCKARAAFAAWGASRKVAQLDSEFPALAREVAPLEDPALATAPSTWSQNREKLLDIASVLKASQAISSNLILDELLQRLLLLALENAGAERGCLILKHGDVWRVVGEAKVSTDTVFVRPSLPLRQAEGKLPLSVVNYVRRVGKEVVIGVTPKSSRFGVDPYIRKHRPKSILCIPIVSQSRTLGLLYLENRLVSNAFSPKRVEILNILAAQAAISIDNAQLYEDLKALNNQLEERVEERTTQLRAAQSELVEKAHQAGMAEIAVNVLHNVGNVLASVYVSVGLISERVLEHNAKPLHRLADMLLQNQNHLSDLVATEKGRLIPRYLSELARQQTADRDVLLQELSSLRDNLDQINVIMRLQEGYITSSCLNEAIEVPSLIDNVVKIQATSLEKHHIEMRRQYASLPPMLLDRHRLQQILLNLISNAIHALSMGTNEPKRLTVRLYQREEGSLRIEVADNGMGIAAHDLTRIFRQGFTTRREGHGFGLHYAANAAREMGGSLQAYSDGPEKGATFVLELKVIDAAMSSAEAISGGAREGGVSS